MFAFTFSFISLKKQSTCNQLISLETFDIEYIKFLDTLDEFL
jgi:hypothetical protein